MAKYDPLEAQICQDLCTARLNKLPLAEGILAASLLGTLQPTKTRSNMPELSGVCSRPLHPCILSGYSNLLPQLGLHIGYVHGCRSDHNLWANGSHQWTSCLVCLWAVLANRPKIGLHNEDCKSGARFCGVSTYNICRRDACGVKRAHNSFHTLQSPILQSISIRVSTSIDGNRTKGIASRADPAA